MSAGIVDLDHSDYDSGNRMTTLQTDLHANSGNTVAENSATTDPQNLLKGIYKMTAGTVNIPAVADTDSTLTEFTNLKTVSLKIANNNTSIPGKTDGIWLQNNAIGRGKADITLDITTTSCSLLYPYFHFLPLFIRLIVVRFIGSITLYKLCS